MLSAIREKLSVAGSGFSGIASLLGSYNVCHSVCMSAIAVLAVIGITVQGMPLAFLLPYATPLWLIALALTAFTAYNYFRKKCVPWQALSFNTGILIAAIPFAELQQFQLYFIAIGLPIAVISAAIWAKSKYFKKGEKTCCQKQS